MIFHSLTLHFEQRIIRWLIVWFGSHSGCRILIDESWQSRRTFCSHDSNGYKQYSHALKNKTIQYRKSFFVNVQNICRVYSIRIEQEQVVVLRKLIHLVDKFVSRLSVDPIRNKTSSICNSYQSSHPALIWSFATTNVPAI